MGKDRTSTTVLKNDFIISVDKDHKGRFRGNQAILIQNEKHKYRGWHYHIEHPEINQKSICNIIDLYLNLELKVPIKSLVNHINELGIGNVEYEPKFLQVFETKDKKTCVLWISSFNGKLHIETNKLKAFSKGILNKKSIIIILKKIKLNSSYSCPKCKQTLFQLDLTREFIFLCPSCDYSINEESIESFYLAKAESGGY